MEFNLSKKQDRANRELSSEQKLSSLVKVTASKIRGAKPKYPHERERPRIGQDDQSMADAHKHTIIE